MSWYTIAAIAIFSIVIFIAGCAANSRPANSSISDAFTTVDRIVNDVKMHAEMSSGTAIIAMRGDEIVYEGYFGYADIAAKRQVDANTSFFIGQAAETVMSLAILLAEERGDVSRETTLQELFPNLQFQYINADAITVKHLLTHTAIIDNEALKWATLYSGQHNPQSRLEMIADTLPLPEEMEMREGYNASSIGYSILAVWMDEEYGTDWRDTVKSGVLSPLGMRHTSGYTSEAAQKGWEMAEPYSDRLDKGQTPLRFRKSDRSMYSANLIMTPRDAARFAMATMNDGRIDGEQIFPPEVFREQRLKQGNTHDIHHTGYAYGWNLDEKFDRSLLLKRGYSRGVMASLSYMPDEKLGVVVIHNDALRFLETEIIENAVYSALLTDNGEQVDAAVRDRIDLLAMTKPISRARSERDEREDSVYVRDLVSDYGLTLDWREYLGTYTNKYGAEIRVSVDDLDRFEFSWGALRANRSRRTYRPEDSMYLDFRSGFIVEIQFTLKDGTVSGIDLDGVEFTKTS